MHNFWGERSGERGDTKRDTETKLFATKHGKEFRLKKVEKTIFSEAVTQLGTGMAKPGGRRTNHKDVAEGMTLQL